MDDRLRRLGIINQPCVSILSDFREHGIDAMSTANITTVQRTASSAQQ